MLLLPARYTLEQGESLFKRVYRSNFIVLSPYYSLTRAFPKERLFNTNYGDTSPNGGGYWLKHGPAGAYFAVKAFSMSAFLVSV